MKILIFEWLTGGGLWHDDSPTDPGSSMQSQGRHMLQSITGDFLDAGVDVVLPIDRRWDQQIVKRLGMEKHLLGAPDDLSEHLAWLAEQVDHILVIAPESNACLLTCLGWIQPFASKLISPDIEFVRIASSKQATIQHLRAGGFRSIPPGMNFGDFQPERDHQFVPPVVLKPVDGAGSEEVQQICNWSVWNPRLARSPEHYWLEKFINGTPVSVSILCGPEGARFLPPTQQLFDHAPLGNYVGAGYPVNPNLAKRATQLAHRAIESMPPTKGYVGIDMVLSDRREQDDCLIEINPRLTMSYLKLREVCRENLAMRMLNIASGIP